MKRVIFVVTLVFLSSATFAQLANTNKPVYLRFPTVPDYSVYKAPGNTLITRKQLKKNKPVMFMIFSPECSHCQHSTEMIVKNIDKFKDIEIMMVSYFPFDEIVQFYNRYQLGRFPNITVARDTKYFFPSYFDIKNFPSFYIYDSNWNFKKFLEGSVSAEQLTAAINPK